MANLVRKSTLDAIPCLTEEQAIFLGSLPGTFPEMIRKVYAAGAIREKEHLTEVIEGLIEENHALQQRLEQP